MVELEHKATVAIQELVANAYQDRNGRVRGRGEAGYVNVFEQPGFSYPKLIENMFAHLELQKMHLNKEQYVECLTVLECLREAAQSY